MAERYRRTDYSNRKFLRLSDRFNLYVLAAVIVVIKLEPQFNRVQSFNLETFLCISAERH